MDILNLIFFIFFILLFLAFIINTITFMKLFNKLKNEYPDFLEKKINKYGLFDARSQMSMIILFGKYQDINNSQMIKKMRSQRQIILFGLSLTVALIILVVFTIFFK